MCLIFEKMIFLIVLLQVLLHLTLNNNKVFFLNLHLHFNNKLDIF